MRDILHLSMSNSNLLLPMANAKPTCTEYMCRTNSLLLYFKKEEHVPALAALTVSGATWTGWRVSVLGELSR